MVENITRFLRIVVVLVLHSLSVDKVDNPPRKTIEIISTFSRNFFDSYGAPIEITIISVIMNELFVLSSLLEPYYAQVV